MTWVGSVGNVLYSIQFQPFSHLCTMTTFWQKQKWTVFIARQHTDAQYWYSKSHMVYRTAPFSMNLTPNPRVRVRVGKVRKPYPNFQMVPLSMTLSDLWPTFQGHNNIQRPITRLTVSRVWSVQWFRFQWPWGTFKVTDLEWPLT